ncbi:MAG: hypothetical protein WDM92_00340 [Caulobacteraceae bacterium]
MQRDFTYVDDIIAGVLAALDRPPAVDPAWDARRPDPSTSGVRPLAHPEPRRRIARGADALYRGAGAAARPQGDAAPDAHAGRRRDPAPRPTSATPAPRSATSRPRASRTAWRSSWTGMSITMAGVEDGRKDGGTAMTEPAPILYPLQGQAHLRRGPSRHGRIGRWCGACRARAARS